MNMLVHFRWDWIHRLIRDVKLSLEHTAGGMPLKARLYSSHIWGLNAKPYGTHVVGTLKQQILDVFMRTESVDSQKFREYGERIAEAWCMPFQTADNRKEVFENLLTGDSCQDDPSFPRGGGWSWTSAGESTKLTPPPAHHASNGGAHLPFRKPG